MKTLRNATISVLNLGIPLMVVWFIVNGLQLQVSPRVLNPNLFEGTVLEATYQPAAVKSIQQGVLAVAVGNLTNTVGITAVNVGSSAIMAQALSSAGASGALHDGDLCRATLTSSTVVTATRATLIGSGAADNGCSIVWTVLEFIPQFVKQRATGATASAGSTAVATGLTQVLLKSVCFWAGMSSIGSSGLSNGYVLGGCSVINTTQLELWQIGSGDTTTHSWTVLEFK